MSMSCCSMIAFRLGPGENSPNAPRICSPAEMTPLICPNTPVILPNVVRKPCAVVISDSASAHPVVCRYGLLQNIELGGVGTGNRQSGVTPGELRGGVGLGQ